MAERSAVEVDKSRRPSKAPNTTHLAGNDTFRALAPRSILNSSLWRRLRRMSKVPAASETVKTSQRKVMWGSRLVYPDEIVWETQEQMQGRINEDIPDEILNAMLDALSEFGQEQAADLYHELNRHKKEIRLLVVEPGVGEDPVDATFKHVFLGDDTRPEYETISYAWGDPDQRGTIHLHGRRISVPASSESALRRMRYPDRVRLLWIDAICINQNDPRERGHQVNIMADIYGSTWRNLIWLGREDQYTKAALDSIEELNEEFRRETNDLSNAFDTLYTPEGQIKYSSKQVSAKLDVAALVRFNTRPWFSRLWVVQEAALAPRSDCFCGRHEIALERVLRAAGWLRHKSESSGDLHYSVFDSCSLLFYYADHRYGYFAVASSFRQPRMLDLLINLRSFHASDRRDHVFALLGLWQKHHPDEILPDSLEPDYTSALSSVLRRATQFAIQEWGDLDALRWVYRRPDQYVAPRFPSWVPRWHELRDPQVEPVPIDSYVEWPNNCDVLMDFQVDGMLCLNGTVLDHVQKLHATVPQWTNCLHTLEYFEDVGLMLRLEFGSRADILREFASMGKRQTKGQETGSWIYWVLFVLKTGDFCRPGENCPLTDEFQDLYLFQNGLQYISQHRQFFVTASKYFGFGPKTMEKGDVLAILAGLDVPAILRPSKLHPGDYEFVGIAAVHGIMKGEAIYKMWEEGKNFHRINIH